MLTLREWRANRISHVPAASSSRCREPQSRSCRKLAFANVTARAGARTDLDWTFYCILEQPGAMDEEARALGARVIHSPVPIARKMEFVRALRAELRRGEYDVLHCHHDIVSAVYLLAAVGLPIERRVVHVHNADESVLTPSRWKQRLYREPMRLACLNLADRMVGISNHTLDTFLSGRTAVRKETVCTTMALTPLRLKMLKGIAQGFAKSWASRRTPEFCSSLAGWFRRKIRSRRDRRLRRARERHRPAGPHVLVGDDDAPRLLDRRVPGRGHPAPGRGVRGRRRGVPAEVLRPDLPVQAGRRDDRLRLARRTGGRAALRAVRVPRRRPSRVRRFDA